MLISIDLFFAALKASLKILSRSFFSRDSNPAWVVPPGDFILFIKVSKSGSLEKASPSPVTKFLKICLKSLLSDAIFSNGSPSGLADNFLPADSYDTADTAWVLTSACLVLLMTPGLSFFYGGMVGKKNIISTMLLVYLK